MTSLSTSKFYRHLSATISSGALILLFSTTAGWAQGDKGIIHQAMQAELKRNMAELSEEGFEKPFYVSYGISDMTSFTAIAMWGALMRSSESPVRSKSVRVLVGNYDFNDESLDNNLNSSPEANEISVPLDDDYFGIRRALWVTTDAVYKSAARQYKKNLATLKEQRKPLAEVPHRAFVKTPVVQLFTSRTPYVLNKTVWEDYVREISAVFNRYNGIVSSGVLVSFQQGNNYFANSEGTLTKTPQAIAILQISAQSKTPDGEMSFDQIVHYALTPDQLPSLELVKKEVTALADQLTSATRIEALEEEYSGPVLFVGPGVADELAGMLFSPREGLQSSNSIPDPNGSSRPDVAAMDSKIGKTIVAESITVKALDNLKKYQQQDLLGSYDLDNEGVVPPAELILIENGVLKNLLNDRTVTKPEQTANGHSSGPGVISVSVNPGSSSVVLKEKLIAQARKEGLEFALMIKDYSIGRLSKIYKVSLDGKEELLRPASMKPLPLRSLKKIMGASTESGVYHVPSRNAINGVVSFIVPQELLLEGVNVSPVNLPYPKEQVYVENPLKK